MTPSQHQGPVGGERARKTEGKRVDCGVWECGWPHRGFPRAFGRLLKPGRELHVAAKVILSLRHLLSRGRLQFALP